MSTQNNEELIGKRIRAKRLEKGMSQEALQEKTDIKNTVISLIENGKRSVGLYNLAKIAKALDVTIDELYYGDESISFIEKAPNIGAKIVNCICELKKEGIINGSEYLDGKGFVLHYFRFHSPITRLLNSLNEFEAQKETYSNRDLYLKQVKESVGNEINKEIEDEEKLTSIHRPY